MRVPPSTVGTTCFSTVRLDTFGVWYLQGYLELVLRTVERMGRLAVSPALYWVTVVRPRLLSIAIGLMLGGYAAWRFDRFEIAPKR